MQTALTGVIPLRGDLRIAIRDAATNEVRWRYEIRNTITYVALKGLVNLISQKGISNPAVDLETKVQAYSVAWLRVGTGVTSPTRSDTDLASPVLPWVPLDDSSKYLTVSNPFEMKITATLGTGDANGNALTEAGLFTRGGIIAVPPGEYPVSSGYYPELFARQIHPVINKTIAFVVDYDWRISFTA